MYVNSGWLFWLVFLVVSLNKRDIEATQERGRKGERERKRARARERLSISHQSISTATDTALRLKCLRALCVCRPVLVYTSPGCGHGYVMDDNGPDEVDKDDKDEKR